MRRSVTVLLLVLAGLLQAWSTAWPWQFDAAAAALGLDYGSSSGVLQIVAMAVALRVVASGRSFWRAWLFATTWLSATFWWLYISMHTYGGLAAWMSALAVLGLAAGLGLYYAAMMWGWRRWCHDAHPVVASLGAAAAWTMAELMRGQWLSGFPWGAVGYAHTDSAVGALAPWIGVYGAGFVAVWIASWIAQLSHWVDASTRACGSESLTGGASAIWAFPVMATVLLAGVAWHARAWPDAWGRSTGVARVSLLQGNIAQEEKFQPLRGVREALDWYAKEIDRATGELVVAPETAIPVLPHELPQGYLGDMKRALQDKGTLQAVMVGIPLGNPDAGYTNSVIAFSAAEDTTYRYDKHHLVPFGEFIPPLFKWFTDMMHIPLGDFERGGLQQASFVHAGQRWAPNICYEDLFGEELAQRFAREPVSEWPTVFVNLSNIGWFGSGIAIQQHLNASRMRALELSRPMIRSTNTGATAIIDHRGHVKFALPAATRSQLAAQVEGRGWGQTPFSYWASRMGQLPVWGVSLLLFIWVTWGRKKREKNRY